MNIYLEKLLEVKELHYRGYLNDEQYINAVNEILNGFVSDYNNENPEIRKDKSE